MKAMPKHQKPTLNFGGLPNNAFQKKPLGIEQNTPHFQSPFIAHFQKMK